MIHAVVRKEAFRRATVIGLAIKLSIYFLLDFFLFFVNTSCSKLYILVTFDARKKN